MVYSGLFTAIERYSGVALSGLKPYIYRDECKDPFLLTGWCEIYLENDATLTICVWSRTKMESLRHRAKIWGEFRFDDGLYRCYTNIANLAQILAFKPRVKRFPKGGKTEKRLEGILGHQIRHYRPVVVYGTAGSVEEDGELVLDDEMR